MHTTKWCAPAPNMTRPANTSEPISAVETKLRSTNIENPLGNAVE